MFYKHDCETCKPLGTFEGNDLYFCPQDGYPTVITRFSNHPGDYISGLTFADTVASLQEAKKRAMQAGYLAE